MREWVQRLLKRGPKYGVARGVAVFGAPAGAGHALNYLLGPSEEFQAWAAHRDIALERNRESLAVLDDHLDDCRNSDVGPSLGNDVGLYLGRVIVETVDGAEWITWPNGHPVVRMPNGRELVSRVVSDFAVRGGDNEACLLLRRWRFVRGTTRG